MPSSENKGPPRATECAFYYCVNTYNATVSVGVLHETVVSSWRNESVSDFYPDFYSNSILSPPLQQDNLNQNVSYYMMSTAYSSLKSFFELQFSGNVVGDAGTILQPSTDFVQALMNLSHYDDIMSSIAQSMTNTIRQQSYGTIKVPGDAWRTETFIHVQWSWLTLPILLVVFTLVFLVTTILQSSEPNSRPWKTSTLPSLYHGLETEVGVDLGERGRVSDMEHEAQSSKVRLQPTERGLMLVKVKGTGRIRFE